MGGAQGKGFRDQQRNAETNLRTQGKRRHHLFNGEKTSCRRGGFARPGLAKRGVHFHQTSRSGRALSRGRLEAYSFARGRQRAPMGDVFSKKAPFILHPWPCAHACWGGSPSVTLRSMLAVLRWSWL